MKKIFILIVVFVGVIQAFGDVGDSTMQIQYWIDDDIQKGNVSSVSEFDIDCSDLSTGLHTLHFRLSDSNGRKSALYEHGFIKLSVPNPANTISVLQYWWDDMHANAVIAPYTDEEFVLSADALPYGLHSLKYRVKDDAGRWSDLRSHYFYRGEVLDSAKITSYTYWWNDLKENKTTVKLDDPSAVFELNESFVVPEEARTDFAGHYTATLNFLFTDNHGRSTHLSSDIEYPDNDAPVTDIDADKYVTSSTVKLTWVESTNDKMGDYNVYYSKDGGPFLLWLPDTQLTNATFKGERGSVYVFTVTGRDAFGNREEYDETKCVSVTFE